MESQGRHRSHVRADQFLEFFAKAHDSTAVKTEHQDGPRVYPFDPQQIGNAMGDHPGLAGTRSGEHQHVFLWRGRDNGRLRLVFEVIDDAGVGLLAGRPIQYLLSAGKVALDKILLVIVEIGCDQAHGGTDLLQSLLRVFVHHVDLEVALGIVGFQRLKVANRIASPLRFGLQHKGHGLPEDGQPLLQVEDTLLVHEGQSPLGDRQGLFHLGKKQEITFQAIDDLLQGELDIEIGVGLFGRIDGCKDRLQCSACCLLTDLHGFGQRLPAALEVDDKAVVSPCPQTNAATLAGQSLPIPSEPIEQEFQHMGGTLGKRSVDKSLIELPEV